MVNTVEFGLPLEKFLQLADLVKSKLKEKDDLLAVKAEELVTIKEQLANALADDAADDEAVTAATQDASSAREELVTLRASIASNTSNQELLAAIASLEGELGFSGDGAVPLEPQLTPDSTPEVISNPPAA